MTMRSASPLWTSVSVAAAAGAATLYLLYRERSKKACSQETEKEVASADAGTTCSESVQLRKIPVSEIHLNENEERTEVSEKKRVLSGNRITIAHGSVTGTSRLFAEQLCERLSQIREDVQLGGIEDWDWWDELLNSEDVAAKLPAKGERPVLLILLPTFTEGAWSPGAVPLKSALEELQNDWRIEKFPLKDKLQVAVFGLGSSAYADSDGTNATMGQPAKEAVRCFQKLGAKCLVRVAVGDSAVGNHAQTSFQTWQNELVRKLAPSPAEQKASCDCGSEKSNEGCCKVEGQQEYHAEPDDSDGDVSDGDVSDEENEPEIMDVEDMGDSLLSSGTNVDSSTPNEMVTPSQATALKKEGYKLIGTHSAVKLCRWTKHQLRGRGGCYKHTFYGITSYQCMEATPSLACANKCVFCWRHHKNPVGKEWRWKTDDPYFIVEKAVEAHVRMIKEARGIPGVRMDRWEEAHTVRHCALSLVGEPIMYPRIDELLGDLHRRQISTFLVTNGQHPQAIEKIRPITQLYVSVDAPTQESLIAIDRPLFKDAWDRLRLSLSSLKDKGQRTVARLTVVKGWNSDEVGGYAKLIALGQVSLVEVKGVTFCGKSDASNLNMTNTPWHHEVIALTTKLRDEINKLRAEGGSNGPPEYDLACEHKHSCSVLLARVDQFAVDDPVSGSRKWRTWIDYDKFHELASQNARDPSFTFSVQDYVADTPEWALFGAEEEGFDPTDKRHRRKNKRPKYTQFDESGIPTHDHNGITIGPDERARLARTMTQKAEALGSDSVITELKNGGKQILEPSLMFRGLVVDG